VHWKMPRVPQCLKFCGTAKMEWVVLRDALYSNETPDDIEQDILNKKLTRENALALLIYYECPSAFCGVKGRFRLFEVREKDGAALECSACGLQHPFGPHWLKYLHGTRKPTDVAGLMHECGDYCYVCGVSAKELASISVKMEVHHTKRFADDGAETGQKIPVCSVCHPVVTSMQRTVRKMLK